MIKGNVCNVTLEDVRPVLEMLRDNNFVIDEKNLCYSISELLQSKTIKCMPNVQIKEYLGKGSFGTTFLACYNRIDKSCGALKIFQENIKDAKLEIKINKKAAKLDVAPKIYGQCSIKIGKKHVFFILSERMEQTLEKYLTTCKDRVQNGWLSITDFKDILNHTCTLVISKIDTLSKNNIVHLDLSLNNIMVNVDDNNNISDIKIIDYGIAKMYKKNVKIKNEKIIRNKEPYYSQYIQYFISLLNIIEGIFKMHKIELLLYICNIAKKNHINIIDACIYE